MKVSGKELWRSCFVTFDWTSYRVDYLIDVVTNEFVQENFVCLKTALDELKRSPFQMKFAIPSHRE